MKIILILDEETGEIWYYIVQDGDPIPAIIETKTKRGKDSDEDENVTH